MVFVLSGSKWFTCECLPRCVRRTVVLINPSTAMPAAIRCAQVMHTRLVRKWIQREIQRRQPLSRRKRSRDQGLKPSRKLRPYGGGHGGGDTQIIESARRACSRRGLSV